MPGVIIDTVQDAYVVSNRPQKNFNGVNRLMLAKDTAIGYMFFSRSVPEGALITRAQVFLYNGEQWVTTGISLQRVAQWTVDRVKFDDQPAVLGPTVTVSKTAAAPNTEWMFDIRTMLQGVVDSGQEWFGLQIRSNVLGRQWFHGAAAKEEAFRIRVEIDWSDKPDAPTELTPTNNVAYSMNKPPLRFDFTDVTGEEDMQAYQVQTSGTNNFAAPTYDSGWQLSGTPQCDLSTVQPAWPEVGVGGSWWWRVRVRDMAGQDSDWSEPAQTRRVAKGVLGLVSPEPSEVVYNLFSNPSVETALTGWTSAASLDSTRVAAPGSVGGFVHRATVNTAITVTATSLTTISKATVAPEVTAGTKFRMRSSVAGRQVTVRIRPMIGSGVSGVVGSRTDSTTIGWKTFDISGMLPAGVDGFRVEIMSLASDPWAAGDWLETDAAIMWTGTDPGEYFDGDSLDTSSYDYAWSGAAHSSVSLRTSTEKKITDPSFPVVWTLTSANQAMYQIVIYNMATMAILYNSGRVTSTVKSASIPKDIIKETQSKYLLALSVWDDVGRADLPGDLPFYQATSVFQFQRTSSIVPPTSLTVSKVQDSPAVLLEFTQSAAADEVTILRDGKVIATGIEPGVLEVINNKYQYMDYGATSRQTHTWEVMRVVNGVSSSNNPTATASLKNRTPWLLDEDNDNLVPLVNFVPEMDESESSEVIFTQSGRGVLSTSTTEPIAFGSCRADISGEVAGSITSEQMVSRIKTMRRQKNKKNRLIWLDNNVIGWAYNIRLESIGRPNGTTDYSLTFDFVEDND